MTEKILVVDDELKMQRVLQVILEEEGYGVVPVGGGEDALHKLEGEHFELVITDLKMPRMSGLELLQEIRKKDDRIPIILMTAYGTIETAVVAMKEGAFDYVLKPFDAEELKLTVKKALQIDRLIREHKYLQEELLTRYKFEEIVGDSQQMKDIFKLVSQVAQTKSTVLIQGESGTGKELIARAIHFNSPRCDKPFIVVNSAAIPETLLESELFGHVKGAFTGALDDRPGRFELANGGSIFLDEIGAMNLSIQAKLLRVIEGQPFERVGGTKEIVVDVRIITATNRDLKQGVASGTFRDDLYFRLNVVPIMVPTLRERSEDISLLAEHFLRFYARELKKNVRRISPKAMQALITYNWPGNIRELRNVIERAIVLSSDETIRAENLPFPVKKATEEEKQLIATHLSYQEAKKEVVEDFERQFFMQLLDESKGNISQAARRAQMDRKNLYEKLKVLGLPLRNNVRNN